MLKLNDRYQFTAIFIKYGQRIRWDGGTGYKVLLYDLRLDGEDLVAAHTWINASQYWNGLTPQDVVTFTARVSRYQCYIGKDGPRADIKLCNPTRKYP